MIPPHVHTVTPRHGGRLTGDVIILEGTLVSVLFQEDLPQIWDLDADVEVPYSWTEEVVSQWSSPPPAVAGEVQTRVELRMDRVTPGARYRLRYRVDLEGVEEVEFVADPL